MEPGWGGGMELKFYKKKIKTVGGLGVVGVQCFTMAYCSQWTKTVRLAETRTQNIIRLFSLV